MTDLRTTLASDRVELDLDEAAFPRDAVYAAAYTFIDRCWVRLDRAGAGRLAVVLRAKSTGSTGAAGSLDGEALAAELRNELLGQAFRQRLADEGRALTDAVVRGAFGGGDDHPQTPGGGDGGDSPADALEDPLGIALSWEAKYGGKPEGEQGA